MNSSTLPPILPFPRDFLITAKSHAAIILCGGQGHRLGALSRYLPKCLLTVGSTSILQRQIEAFRSIGINEVILAIGHLGDKIRKLTSSWQVKYNVHFVEASNVGTAGALIKAVKQLPVSFEHFWVSMGDIVCQPDFQSMWTRSILYDSKAIILGTSVIDPSSYGILECDSAGCLIGFKEKQSLKEPAIIDAGFYYFRKEFLAGLSDTESLSLEYDVFPRAMGVAVVEHIGYWFDIGTVARLRTARNFIDQCTEPSRIHDGGL